MANPAPDGSRNSLTTAEMLEMLNLDILPYFDNYESDSFVFMEKYRAEEFISETSSFIVVALNNGKNIEISKSYFQSPSAEKNRTIEKLREVLS